MKNRIRKMSRIFCGLVFSVMILTGIVAETVTVHADALEKDSNTQEVAISTFFSDLKGKQMIAPIGDAELIDVVTVRLTSSESYEGKKFRVEGMLMDQFTGKPLVNTFGEPITTKTELDLDSQQLRDGNIKVRQVFQVDASKLAGKKIVAFEKVFCNDELLCSHENINSESQTIQIERSPSIRTSLMAGSSKMVIEGEIAELTDTVYYEWLVPGVEYTLKGVLMDRATGKPLYRDKNEVTAVTKFVPEKETGEVKVKFTFHTSGLAGTSLVAFETLKCDTEFVAEHKDLRDPDQTVFVIRRGTPQETNEESSSPGTSVPGISTILTDTEGNKTVQASKQMKLIDTISYRNLIPGEEYSLRGELIDPVSGQSAGDGILIFRPKTASGEIRMVMTADTTEHQILVAVETLYDHNGSMVAEHRDWNDQAQTVMVEKSFVEEQDVESPEQKQPQEVEKGLKPEREKTPQQIKPDVPSKTILQKAAPKKTVPVKTYDAAHPFTAACIVGGSVILFFVFRRKIREFR